jgi:hypothetical protein
MGVLAAEHVDAALDVNVKGHSYVEDSAGLEAALTVRVGANEGDGSSGFAAQLREIVPDD